MSATKAPGRPAQPFQIMRYLQMGHDVVSQKHNPNEFEGWGAEKRKHNEKQHLLDAPTRPKARGVQAPYHETRADPTRGKTRDTSTEFHGGTAQRPQSLI
jgi:hypothetical protein